jgi:hypothetical protein
MLGEIWKPGDMDVRESKLSRLIMEEFGSQESMGVRESK